MSRQVFLSWLREIESKWEKKWSEAHLFEPKVEPNRKKYFITVPYPYTNGPLHIGHGRTYTIGDIVARYKRLRGYNVLFPMAFHITGTPIIAISERIARGDQKVIARYRYYISIYIDDEKKIDEIIESFKDPLSLAVFFAERIHMDFDALGYSIDWRRKFHTGEPIYNAFVTWQYLRLRDKGLITRGDHIVTYCLLHKQPEGEDDIQDADVNPVEILEFTAVKFRLEEDENTYLVAATLRPETLFGATNLWVNPEATYVKVRWRNEDIIISKDALVKLQHQHPDEEFKVVEEFEGRRLIGKWVISPLGQRLIVLPAEFVDPDNATGIVYSEPSDAPYDYVALMEIKKNPEKLREYGVDPEIVARIEPEKIIEVEGVKGHHAGVVVEEMKIESQLDPRLVEATKIVYKEQYYRGVMIVEDPEFKGIPVKEAKEKIKKKLEEANMAFTFYELSRKAYCRAGGKIIAAKIKGQWFIDYSVPWWKETTRKYVAEEMKILPIKYRKAMLDAIDWLEKRPCARKRGLGTRLPFDPEWVIESLSDSTIYMAFYTIAHIIRRENIRPEQLTPEVFDYVFYGKGDPKEISEKTKIPLETLEEMRREFTYWYPVDQRHTGIAHISNHLSFFIYHHTALFPPKHWPRMISLNDMVIREGAKMSKSKGNVILLRDIVSQYSADLYRLYIAGAANLESLVDWRERDVEVVIDTMKRFVGLVEATIKTPESTKPMNRFIDRWFISKFNKLIKEATENLENMEIRNYVQNSFYQVLSLIDHYRDRTSYEEALQMIKKILPDWLKLLNPVIPHLTEELWEKLGGEGFLSIAKWPEPREEEINEEVEVLEEKVMDLIEDMKNVLNVLKPKPNKAVIIVADEWKREAIKMYVEGKQLREIIKELTTKYGLKGREKEIVLLINQYRKQPDKWAAVIPGEKEFEILVESREYISRKTGLEIEVMWEKDAREKGYSKATKAVPLRPGIQFI